MMVYSMVPRWIPPVFVLLRLGRAWLPLPVVVVWPLLLLAWLLLGVALLVTPRQAWLPRHRDRLRTWWTLWCLLGALRGLSVNVRSEKADEPRDTTTALPGRDAATPPALPAGAATTEEASSSRSLTPAHGATLARTKRSRPSRVVLWVI